MSTTTANTMALDEAYVMDGFHTFLTNSLAQAKAERLIDEEVLASAEADLMVSGPALCLYFAALRSSTTPPSVPIPRSGVPPGTPPIILSAETCPPAFRAFFSIWSTAVPLIQSLPSEQQHDLARVICGREPVSAGSARQDALKRIAADLRAVAIEISQRRTFQERYQADLQAALDHGRPVSADGRRTPSPLRATFVPPPGYESAMDSKAAAPIPGSTHSSPGRPGRPLPSTQGHGMHVVNVDQPNGRPRPSTSAPSTPRIGATEPRRGHTRGQSSGQYLELPGAAATSNGAGSSFRRPPSPTILTPQDPAILVIRETLYAALADVLARTKELRTLLKTDPGRAYFASVGLAILEFALVSLTPEGNIRAVLGNELKLEDAPREYRPLMAELQRIALRSRELEKEDNERAVELLSASEDPLPEPRMDRVRMMLVKGVARGWEEMQADDEEMEAMAGAGEESQRRRLSAGYRRRGRAPSPAGTALELTNRINALALGMVRLPAFRERQDMIFKVLAGAR